MSIDYVGGTDADSKHSPSAIKRRLLKIVHEKYDDVVDNIDFAICYIDESAIEKSVFDLNLF